MKTNTTIISLLVIALLSNCFTITFASGSDKLNDPSATINPPSANSLIVPVDGDPDKLVKGTIIINTSTEKVLWTIEEHRQGDEQGKQHRQCASCHAGVAEILEDKFGVFMLGCVHNVWQERKVSPRQITFKLISSNKLKEGYGTWIVTPLANGQTLLELDSYVCPYMQVPFAAMHTKRETKNDIASRLLWIKRDAEAEKR